MKRSFFLCFLLLQGCVHREIGIRDLVPAENPNKHLLPPLAVQIDTNNLEGLFSIEKRVNTKQSGTWKKHYTTSVLEKDKRVVDMTGMIQQFFDTNILESSGKTAGSVTISLNNGVEWKENQYHLPNICLLPAYPFLKNGLNGTCFTAVYQVSIFDINKNLVKRYTEESTGCVNKYLTNRYKTADISRKAVLSSTENAMETIQKNIEKDSSEIISKLQKALTDKVKKPVQKKNKTKKPFTKSKTRGFSPSERAFLKSKYHF